MRPDGQLAEELKPSTMASLKEHVLPVEVAGADQRSTPGGWKDELLLNS
jgi:hypothetical protein